MSTVAVIGVGAVMVASFFAGPGAGSASSRSAGTVGNKWCSFGHGGGKRYTSSCRAALRKILQFWARRFLANRVHQLADIVGSGVVCYP